MLSELLLLWKRWACSRHGQPSHTCTKAYLHWARWYFSFIITLSLPCTIKFSPSTASFPFLQLYCHFSHLPNNPGCRSQTYPSHNHLNSFLTFETLSSCPDWNHTFLIFFFCLIPCSLSISVFCQMWFPFTKSLNKGEPQCWGTCSCLHLSSTPR